jgi:nicotinamidase-related amidase
VAAFGFLSNVCVESTARSVYDPGYNVRVIRDATAAASQGNQEYVERQIYPLLGGAMTVGEFIAELE